MHNMYHTTLAFSNVSLATLVEVLLFKFPLRATHPVQRRVQLDRISLMISPASQGANGVGAIGATSKSAQPYCAHVRVGELLAKCAMCAPSDNHALYMNIQLGHVPNIFKMINGSKEAFIFWMQIAAIATLTMLPVQV